MRPGSTLKRCVTASSQLRSTHLTETAATMSGHDFLKAMPPTLARQREILSRMLNIVELEPALRWFELGCSLARGGGDELSDIDCGVGIDDQRWKDALTMGALLATAGGQISDGLRQVFPSESALSSANGSRETGKTCWRIVTLYDDGAQLSC